MSAWPARPANTPMVRPSASSGPVSTMHRRQMLQRLGAWGAVTAVPFSPAWANTADVSPARHAWLPQSRRVGHGALRMLGLNLYEATLYALADFDAAAFATHPLVLEIRYRRSFTGDAIAERSLKEMRRGGALNEARAERWLQFMRSAFPDVKAGDRLTGLWLPAQGTTRLAANDGSPAEFSDAEFGTRFFGIWLGPNTSQPALREQLLGLKGPG